MPSTHASLHFETQQTLTAFLNTELKLGGTFAQSALLARDAAHMDHYAQAKANAAKAAESVRRFMSRVADLRARAEIGQQLAELDRRIAAL